MQNYMFDGVAYQVEVKIMNSNQYYSSYKEYKIQKREKTDP